MSKRNGGMAVVWTVALAIMITGCAPMAYRGAFNDYSDVYSDSQNHQMLLNLARLSQHAPPYFFQSGNIQANYTFSGNLSASGQQTTAGPHPYSWLVSALGASAT